MGNPFKNLFRLDMRRMVGVHQGRERGDVLLTILVPGVLMLISSYTNARALTAGNLSFALPHLVNIMDALLLGLFVEAVVFSCFKLVKMLLTSGTWRLYPAALFPAAVGLVGVVVSAGCGLAWVAKSGQMEWMDTTVSAYLPFGLGKVFQSGVGLFFPIALVIYALYDIEHLIREHVKRGGELGSLSVHGQSAQHHQDRLLAMQKEEDEKLRDQYRQIVQFNAQRALASAKSGDLSFGLNEALEKKTTKSLAQSSQTYVRPVITPPAPPPLSLPAATAPTMPMQQPPLTGQCGPAPAWPTGNTQNIPMPPLPQQQPNGGMSGSNPYRREAR